MRTKKQFKEFFKNEILRKGQIIASVLLMDKVDESAECIIVDTEYCTAYSCYVNFRLKYLCKQGLSVSGVHKPVDYSEFVNWDKYI